MLGKLVRILSISLIALPLASCTETQLASHVLKKTLSATSFSSDDVGHFKVGKPYRIKGKWYTPQERYNFSQTGVASWYGPNFHGKDTANGETFNQYELTAAHKTLQLPSIIRVTNLENGRSLVLRVNDRGPFSKNRILDVSNKAADLLGFKNQGTAKVRIDVLPNESKQVAQMAKDGKSTKGVEIAMNQKGYRYQAPPEPIQPETQQASLQISPKPFSEPAKIAPVQREAIGQLPSKPPVANTTHTNIKKPSQLYVQAGAFSLEQNAQNLVEELKIIGKAHVHPSYINGKPYYRVRFGPFETTQNADIVVSQLMNYGNDRAMIVVADR